MKRAILYIIGIALCLQSCHRESHPNNPDAGAYTISMAPTSVQGASRALINGIDDLQNLGFVVYGHSTAGDNKQQVFEGDNVTYDTAEKAWGYADEDTELRYWNAAADYSFGAYAPQMVGVTETETDDIITSLSIPLPQWQQVNGCETDLIVATSQGAATDYLMAGGTVNLAFNHVYARLIVKLVKDMPTMNTYTLTSLHYGKESSLVPQSIETTYTFDYTNGNSSWVETGKRAAYEAYSGNGEVTITEQTFADHLIIPHEINGGLPIQVSYKIGNNPHSSWVETGQTTFEAGKVYTYTLRFEGGNVLTISPVEIQEWDDVEDVNDNPVYNW